MSDEYNPFDITAEHDTCDMTSEELREYGYGRLSVMLKMERNAAKQLDERNSPFQHLVLETAKHHVERCKTEYGIKRQDIIRI